ncbi:hypothetical protein [Bartonella doshiae]|uniref:Uncharacterized protein n=2 Tax=Bartonella doshiae TaxID=33044 RepID=A0A380ZDB9_BARDO|nr:hypothetical protein [Bartonella doshiae]EJF82133.1 hypothetical protein MCS_00054 [Bartonella doshiae NCTC 12862 = ATCC 700133]MBB6160128.1 hypothetical protein [Bartonella doshiae]SUV44963.1 Uncharacterised protein [Bartonella doshiae]
MTAQISKTLHEKQDDTSLKWDLALNIQKEIKETMKSGVVSRTESRLIIFISLCLSIILTILGNADKAQMDAATAIGLICVLLLYGSLPISIVLYIVIKKKLNKVIKQLDEALAHQNPE